MSRLLHAAARGARIEDNVLGRWTGSESVYLEKDITYSYRIHPDDEHLAYGPISTALRGVALTRNFEDSNIPYVRVEFEREDGYWSSTEEQRRVFCLILAEALADEGM
jgi:hypothetical protein